MTPWCQGKCSRWVTIGANLKNSKQTSSTHIYACPFKLQSLTSVNLNNLNVHLLQAEKIITVNILQLFFSRPNLLCRNQLSVLFILKLVAELIISMAKIKNNNLLHFQISILFFLMYFNYSLTIWHFFEFCNIKSLPQFSAIVSTNFYIPPQTLLFVLRCCSFIINNAFTIIESSISQA